MYVACWTFETFDLEVSSLVLNQVSETLDWMKETHDSKCLPNGRLESDFEVETDPKTKKLYFIFSFLQSWRKARHLDKIGFQVWVTTKDEVQNLKAFLFVQKGTFRWRATVLRHLELKQNI